MASDLRSGCHVRFCYPHSALICEWTEGGYGRDFQAISLYSAYRTGTTNTEMSTRVIPPNEGIAMGTITSEPRPVEVRTGKATKIFGVDIGQLFSKREKKKKKGGK